MSSPHPDPAPSGRPLRVLHVSMHTSPAEAPGTGDAGGMNVVVRETAKALAQLGARVDIATRAIEADTVRTLIPSAGEEEPVVLWELGPTGSVAKAELPELCDEFGENIAQLLRAADTERDPFDLIHAHYWLSGIAALPAALEARIPLVQSFHTLAAMTTDGRAPEPGRRWQAERYLADQASAVISASGAETTVLLDAVRAPAARVWVVSPGVDEESFVPLGINRDATRELMLPRFGVERDAEVIVVAGRIQPLKGQDFAVAIAAELARRGRSRVRVLMVGEPTPGEEAYAAELRSRITTLGAPVQLLGALGRDDLATLMAMADAAIIPSHSESFGLVALESAASGVPVVGMRGSGLDDAIAHGRSGLLVAGRDPSEWADALERLLDGTAGITPESAREFALGHTWMGVGSQLTALYSKLVGTRAGA